MPRVASNSFCLGFFMRTLNSELQWIPYVGWREGAADFGLCERVVVAEALRHTHRFTLGPLSWLMAEQASGCLSLPSRARWLTGLCGTMWLCHVIIWLAAALLLLYAVVFNLLRCYVWKITPCHTIHVLCLLLDVVVLQASLEPLAIFPPRFWGRTHTASRWISGPVVSLQLLMELTTTLL